MVGDIGTTGERKGMYNLIAREESGCMERNCLMPP